MRGDKKGKKMNVQLSPIELVWLHSQHLFQKIEENQSLTHNQIKFYKNNSGVEIRQISNQSHSQSDALSNAKYELESLLAQNVIKLMCTSLHKDIYVRISKEARKEFPGAYIIYLHYETFENCCRKLRDKFGITSIAPELERLQQQNQFFCFLIAEKSRIEEVQKYTTRILNSQLSCASTTFSNGNRPMNSLNIYKRRTMSVSSLRGSVGSYEEMDHCINNSTSEAEQQIFQISEQHLHNLTEQQMLEVKHRRQYAGCTVHVETYEGKYLSLKKKLYYANRLQCSPSAQVQPIYGYSMVEISVNRWQLSLITDKVYEKLSDLTGSVTMHGVKARIELLYKVARGVVQLHRNRESYGDLREQNILVDECQNVYLSSSVDKSIPPHCDAMEYDMRAYLLLVYRLMTGVEISLECLARKFEKQRFFCNLNHRCKNKFLKEFLNLVDELFIQSITPEQYLKDLEQLIRVSSG